MLTVIGGCLDKMALVFWEQSDTTFDQLIITYEKYW